MTTTIGKLDPVFTSLIQNILKVERQPIDRLNTRRDTLEVQRGVYNDLKTKLDALQMHIQELISTQASYALSDARSVTFSNAPSGATVASASASSVAVVGDYDLAVTTLAKAHRVRSKQLTYSDQALGLSGKVVFGGAAARAVDLGTDVEIAGTVTGYGAAALDSGQTELGSDTYFIETRNDAAAGWQFRVVDSNGSAVSVKQASGSSYTSAWQVIPSGGGAYDSGRGLTFSFGADSGIYVAASRTSGNAGQVSYTAQGASITINATDSLVDIASAINNATYAAGNDVAATIVDRQLVLTAVESGSAHAVIASDSRGTVLQDLEITGADGGADDVGAADGFMHTIREAGNAAFTVNGLSVTRSKNTGITDVISGVTLNLAADAEGKSATLTIAPDGAASKNVVATFVNSFNDLLTYLHNKTALTENADNTYTRGALSGELIFTTLRSDLLSMASGSVSNSGTLARLSEIGVTVDDDLKLTISDADALEAALETDFGNVTSLLDTLMTNLDNKVGQFTGTSGYVEQSVDMVDDQTEALDEQIGLLETRLDKREQMLTEQYAAMQTQLLSLTYMQQTWQSIYSSTNYLV